ncbi:MAG: hypothetical protein JWQ09_1258, partial [Segetibacter sp.]|nr:hypothetical protein [Segetibacter sp.]
STVTPVIPASHIEQCFVDKTFRPLDSKVTISKYLNRKSYTSSQSKNQFFKFQTQSGFSFTSPFIGIRRAVDILRGAEETLKLAEEK